MPKKILIRKGIFKGDLEKILPELTQKTCEKYEEGNHINYSLSSGNPPNITFLRQFKPKENSNRLEYPGHNFIFGIISDSSDYNQQKAEDTQKKLGVKMSYPDIRTRQIIHRRLNKLVEDNPSLFNLPYNSSHEAQQQTNSHSSPEAYYH